MTRIPGRRLLAAAALTFLASGAALAQDKSAAPARPDAAKGQAIAAGACAACHGADGNSPIATNPILAGQHAEYLVKQLNDMAKPATAADARVAPAMTAFATMLSPEDKRNVAAWYAAQKHKDNVARNKDTVALGRQIYRAGIPEKNVPACAGCHSPNGAGIPIQYARLSGQWADYSEAQLKAFRDGTRRNSAQMSAIAARLSDAEMKAVADFMAGLK